MSPGTIPNGGTTDDIDPVINISGAQPNRPVRLYYNGRIIPQALTANSSGNVAYSPVPSLGEATYEWTARTISAAGLFSPLSAGYTITVDTPTPVPPPPSYPPEPFNPPVEDPLPFPMPLSVEMEMSQLAGLSVTESPGFTRLSQLSVLAPIAYSAEQVDSSQIQVLTPTEADMDVEVSQLQTLAVVLPSPADPRVRVWTYTQDQHDFYIVKCGRAETLVYDYYAKQWYQWGSGDSPLWRANEGMNWLGAGPLAYIYGSNVVVGDRANGALYFLNPNGDVDDDFAGVNIRPFLRMVTGQIVHSGYMRLSCPDVYVGGSIGQTFEPTLNTLTLDISDDRGLSYWSAGSRNIAAGDYNQRISWRSLGSISNPGRLFRWSDYGSLKRFDCAEMLDGK